jgi:RimJ/RimL family protein N-acetyltransferase
LVCRQGPPDFESGLATQVRLLPGELYDRHVFDFQPTLTGPTINLRGTTSDDRAELFAVASDPAIWELHPSRDRWQEPVFEEFFQDGLASGGMLTVRESSTGAVIGSSRFSTGFVQEGEVEIGWTFLSRTHWGGATNREMKHLMLTHAFASFPTVVFWVGRDNIRSRRAVEKIGGSLLDRAREDRASHVAYALDRERFHGLIEA